MFFKAIKGRLDGVVLVVSMAEGRVIVRSENRNSHDIRLPEDCARAFALSRDLRLLATAYWHRRGVDIWPLDGQGEVTHLGGGRVDDLIFDHSGKFLVAKSEMSACVYSLDDGRVTRLSRVYHLADEVMCPTANVGLLPTFKRGSICQVMFEPVRVAILRLSVADRLRWLGWSPQGEQYSVLDWHGRVYALKGRNHQVVWQENLAPYLRHEEDGIYVGVHSGDGEWVAFTVTETAGFRTLVLDAASGRLLHILEDCVGGDFPLQGKTVLTEGGEIIDLRNGKVISDLTRPAWWCAE